MPTLRQRRQGRDVTDWMIGNALCDLPIGPDRWWYRCGVDRGKTKTLGNANNPFTLHGCSISKPLLASVKGETGSNSSDSSCVSTSTSERGDSDFRIIHTSCVSMVVTVVLFFSF